jgi:mannosyl-oligosaccharide alpha-1,3-glucosidase
MFSQYPSDSALFNLEKQYMLSDKLLVAPVTESKVSQIQVRFPADDIWYDLDTFSSFDLNQTRDLTIDVDMKKTPVYIRGGSIIPMKEIKRSASIYMKNDPISLVVALNRHGHAQGNLFLDDEQSFAYMQGFYLYFSFLFQENKLLIDLVDPQTKFIPLNTFGNITIVGLNYKPTEVKAVHRDGRQKFLKMILNQDNVVKIDATEVRIADKIGWTIEFTNSAFRNSVCSVLLISSMLLTFLLNFFFIELK